jgi:rhamnulose-1-phosphate aldolase
MEEAMSVPEPYPTLDELIAAVGEAGQRMASIDASEGAAGNISLFLDWHVDLGARFSISEPIDLPISAPALAGGIVICTGSGRRLRDIKADPDANLGVAEIEADGLKAVLHTSPRRRFERLTSEWNSHLSVHDDAVKRTGTNLHAIVHAQPRHITFLSQIAAYRDEAFCNSRLLRWEAETIINLPTGIGVLPFCVPGSLALQCATVESLRTHKIVLWSKHGVMARSDQSVTRAADWVEYVETAAAFEYMDILAGGRAEGLTLDEIRSIVQTFGVDTKMV